MAAADAAAVASAPVTLLDPLAVKFGRFLDIPTTSVAQVGATLAAWFGTPAAALGNLFPNLAAFPADKQNLGFML